MSGDAASYAPPLHLYLATIGAAARVKATALAHRLRQAGLAVEVEHREAGMKAQFRRAEKLRARFALAIGDAELASERAKLKDMAARSEIEVSLDAAAISALIQRS
jgi:histidyl-tRNA synthetase